MSLRTLSARLQYAGGDTLGRINKQKLNSLHAALKNDYQSRPIQLEDGSVTYCLMNNDPAGLKSDYDKKILSVDFDSGLQPGDVYECLDDNSHWMVYLPVLTETAYLRSSVVRCRYTLNIEDVDYWIYCQGPTETDLRWYIKNGTNFNELNLSGTIYIKNNKQTRNYFSRFRHIKIDGHTWEVQVTDSISTPGVLELEIQEYYDNQYEELPKVIRVNDRTQIVGKTLVKHDAEYGYQIPDEYFHEGWKWSIEGNKRVHIVELYRDGRTCKIKVEDGAIGSFDVLYGTKNQGYKTTVYIDVKEPDIEGPEEVYPYDEVKYFTKIPGSFWIDSTELAEIVEQTENTCEIKILTGKKGSFILYFMDKEKEIEYQLPIKIKSF